VVVTAGGIEAIYLAMLGVLEPGDEVLLPDPGWTNFRMMARVVHAVECLYPLRPELGFLPAPEDLERAVGPRTRAVVRQRAGPAGSAGRPHRAPGPGRPDARRLPGAPRPAGGAAGAAGRGLPPARGAFSAWVDVADRAGSARRLAGFALT
jgi:hypothetical protein